ncbi:radical SAM protein, partial [Candidatus Aerophobetes bacterium]|nr:radical SAM protein [Candidatus Aerophobetes bacterium]
LAMGNRLCRQWIDNFVQELKTTKIAGQILWRISCRVDDVVAQLINKMKEVGLMSVYIGIESGNNEGLRTYNKHYTVDDSYKVVTILQDLEMPFEFGFMILNPDSTFATLKQDIAFLKEIGKSGQAIVHFTKMVPYAGTSIARRLKKEGKLKGTIDAPDYTYKDPRIELLQLFFTQAFHFRNFDNNGLVERLRHAKFDALVLSKFFSHTYDTNSYARAIQDLIRESNEVCLEKMSLAVNFMERQAEKDIFDNWQFLDHLVQEEKDMERRITSSLDSVLAHYS